MTICKTEKVGKGPAFTKRRDRRKTGEKRKEKIKNQDEKIGGKTR